MAKRKKGKSRGLLILLIFIAFLALLMPGKRGILNQIRIRLQERQLAKEIQELTETKERLEEKKEALKEPETVEKIAREEYGMAKKDEKVYHVVPKEND
ncbi:septum formation initiator family protein [bacterium]|nr:septum formation initiator family protein [bacterium]